MRHCIWRYALPSTRGIHERCMRKLWEPGGAGLLHEGCKLLPVSGWIAGACRRASTRMCRRRAKPPLRALNRSTHGTQQAAAATRAPIIGGPVLQWLQPERSQR
ncbi:hypothetical protein E2562_032842 [Oryza meyeriana var. granulata]|uniref:Uncharacterized protein n=1 Tax=Oryza meyeriana var. granulata TaxID=110450 RepID=A0A6G1DRB3_9ORYZ|nr:hypothetical protein E2562_032842 [Oryza meyeriana var. granulata]